jgi:hypothetical protein
MSCSFDKKEYCPLEHSYEKSNIKWQLNISLYNKIKDINFRILKFFINNKNER